ncbi:MAG: hypothetical protein MUE47_06810 [Acidobacteria bacterium]|jgi:hypothetical protein|nr:hypothetical protein [Acidobacteriota bacterium]
MTESEQFDALVRRCRATCLWFVAPDVAPRDREAQFQFLAWIERYGDRDEFVMARKLKAWLSHHSSATFSVS